MIDTDKYEGHTPKHTMLEGWYIDTSTISNCMVIHSNETDNIIAELVMANGEEWTEEDYANARLIADAPLLLEEVKRLSEENDLLRSVQRDGIEASAHDNLILEIYRLREDYEKMSEVLRQHGMDICRHCRVIYRDDEMNHPHYPSLHPWHMDGMCMKEMIE